MLFGLPPVSQEAWLPLRNLNRKRHCFPGHHPQVTTEQLWTSRCEGERERWRRWRRRREGKWQKPSRARVNRQEGVVSKSVPLLMCVVSLPPGLHTLQILHSSYWISKSPDLPTYSSSSHHCGSYSCSLLCLSDFDSVTPTLMGTKGTLRRCKVLYFHLNFKNCKHVSMLATHCASVSELKQIFFLCSWKNYNYSFI